MVTLSKFENLKNQNLNKFIIKLLKSKWAWFMYLFNFVKIAIQI